ncbi:hypothetical protein AAFA46_08060 [Oscillospiraceae bacterium WX1]
MALTLITDRTTADVTRVKTLRSKINAEGWTALTPVEQMEWLAGMKGSYNSNDLNRVGEAVQYLAGLLNGYGYPVTVNPKTDWVQGNIPTSTQMAAYLTDVAAIKARFYGTTEIPGAMNNLAYEQANNIELLLLEVDTLIIGMVTAFQYAGTFYAEE